MTTIKVLDHGYVKLIESMGTDETIIEAARMSTARGFEGWDEEDRCLTCDGPEDDCAHMVLEPSFNHSFRKFQGDEKLLAFLYKNRHMTPFEMCELHVEVMAPILVFREWHRHRTQSYNEMSARYVPLPDLNYVPTVERLLMNSTTNKQAGTIAGAQVLTVEGAVHFQNEIIRSYELGEVIYQNALRAGVPKELARVHLPVGRYSRMRAKTDLRNWLGFLELRTAPNAQWEIRQYACAVAKIIESVWPHTFALFSEGHA